MSGVVCVRGLRAGQTSRPFSARDLLLAAQDHRPATVYVDVDAEGFVTCAGGAARAAAHARRARRPSEARVRLARGAAGLQLRVTRDTPPHHDLPLWVPPAPAPAPAPHTRDADENLSGCTALPSPVPPGGGGGGGGGAGACLARLEALASAWGRARGGHVCVYCGKLYSRKYGLKIHIRTHTGYRPLRCPHCARRFGDPSNLNKHVRLHAARDKHK